MRTFDYSFLKDQVPAELVGITGILQNLNARETIRKEQYPKSFEEMRKKAVVESVTGSNAIEGIVTTKNRIEEIISGAAPQTHDEMEIAGYRDALSMIHSEQQLLDISKEQILIFHRMIEAMTDPGSAGCLKTSDNYIIEIGPDGTRRVRFKPVSAVDTPQALEQMLLAYYTARQDASIPDLFLIPCVILDFLCIHPFKDGNGRISRLLTVLLLYKSGYDVVRFISLENQINIYKDSYYQALERSSYNWHENTNDYWPFVVNFLQLLYRCYKKLDETFAEFRLQKIGKARRVEMLLMEAVVPISKSEIQDRFPDISIQTIENVLSTMVKDGRLEKIGSYRNARYKKS